MVPYKLSACEYRIYTTFGQRVPMLGRVAQPAFSQPQTRIPILTGLQINTGIKNFITQAQQFNAFPQFAFGDHICCNLKKIICMLKCKGQVSSFISTNTPSHALQGPNPQKTPPYQNSNKPTMPILRNQSKVQNPLHFILPISCLASNKLREIMN